MAAERIGFVGEALPCSHSSPGATPPRYFPDRIEAPGAACPKLLQLDLAATYDSAGLLHTRTNNAGNSTVFYFAGRPVALLETVDSWRYLTTDHLGTPILATDETGAQVWQGGFEPFGQDYAGAQAAGVFLRFPGQWDDATWQEASLGAEGYYNVHRWYGAGTGRYTRVDPEWTENLMLEQSIPAALSHYLYGQARPMLELDPLGLLSFNYHRSCRNLSEMDRQSLESAANNAAEKAPLTPQCKANPSKNIKVKCGSCGNNCGRQFGRTICVNMSMVQKGQCGAGPQCLASTILHEVVHTCGGDEREAYACEKRFYPDSCRITVPEKHRPTPDCPTPCTD